MNDSQTAAVKGVCVIPGAVAWTRVCCPWRCCFRRRGLQLELLEMEKEIEMEMDRIWLAYFLM